MKTLIATEIQEITSMEAEIKCEAAGARSRTCETKPVLYESNLIETLFEPEQTFKEETDEDSLNVKEETVEKWVCYATDLLSASSSADFSENNVPIHNDPSSGEEKALTEHIRSAHTNSRRYICKTCGKAFVRGYHLKRHTLIHSSESSSHSLNASSSSSVSETNLSTHDEEKKTLTEHSRSTHTNVRRHVCGTCGKAFTRGYHLKRHSLIHSSERASRTKTWLILRTPDSGPAFSMPPPRLMFLKPMCSLVTDFFATRKRLL
ncbi:hypothetical protein KIN20_028220 [Parelaphostrongylus tenuis]|uniref:C2H2-type domain-containing protein n=1 Tax=Parelaphostrongylus tenuis TaxID=148309 RepID=A0AAD5WEK7_PARTN|nr:hypothetical protein KIN20_028220 [Parelaphostrongylus tenuis]